MARELGELGFPVFDGDNHLYETRDALTAYLPAEYKGAVRYVEVDGRTKIATMGQISEYNPTFDVVAAPGAQEDFFRHEVTEHLPLDHVLFGSDFPHPEGLKEPLSYVDELGGLTDEPKALVMGGNLTELMKVGA
jgi:predicted TIM-barrel fold metal-dependent hydrolase